MRHGKKYRMEIVYNRKRYTEYGFSLPEEAFARYCIRSAEMHGEFGRPTTSVTVPPPTIADPVVPVPKP